MAFAIVWQFNSNLLLNPKIDENFDEMQLETCHGSTDSLDFRPNRNNGNSNHKNNEQYRSEIESWVGWFFMEEADDNYLDQELVYLISYWIFIPTQMGVLIIKCPLKIRRACILIPVYVFF